MFFKRDKIDGSGTGLTPGIEAEVAAFVEQTRDAASDKAPSRVFSDAAPLQLLTDADVAYFVAAMEAEAARIDDEAAEISRKRLADIAAKDAQIAALNREIETRKAALQAQDAEIDRRAKARADLLDKVKKIAPAVVTDNLNEDAIRTAVVKSKFGDQAVAGKPQAYIDSRFDFLVDSSNVDPFREVLKDGLLTNLTGKAAADKAYLDMCADLNSAHKAKH